MKALHLYLLGGEGEPPDELLISRYCEEFHATPRVALLDVEGIEFGREGEPFGLSWRVIETRDYVRAYSARESARKHPDAEAGPTGFDDLMDEIEQEIAEEARREEGLE